MDAKVKWQRSNASCFSGLGVMKDNHTLRTEARPFQMTGPRKAPLPLHKKTKEGLDGILESGVS